MFRIEVTGGAPGANALLQAYEDRALAERVARALVGYFSRHPMPGYRQGAQVVDDQGRWVWRQDVGQKAERPN